MKHFELFLSNVLSPTTRLFRVSKRQLIDVVQTIQELPHVNEELVKDERIGETEHMVNDFKTFVDKVGDALTEDEKVEGRIIVAEERTEHDVEHILEWLDFITKDLQELPAERFSNPDLRGRLIHEFTTMRQELHEQMTHNSAELAKQFQLIKQEAVGRSFDVRMITSQMGSLKETMDDLWSLRAKYHKVRREEGDLEHDAHDLHENLRQLFKESGAKTRDYILKEVTQEEKAFRFKEFHDLLKDMVKAFTLIIKVSVQLYFLVQAFENDADAMLQHLRDQGFPVKDWEKLKGYLADEKRDVHTKVGDLLKAMRWGRHNLQPES